MCDFDNDAVLKETNRYAIWEVYQEDVKLDSEESPNTGFGVGNEFYLDTLIISIIVLIVNVYREKRRKIKF